MCESYEDHCCESPWKIRTIEEKFTLDLGDFEVWGAIDTLLEWPSGNLTIRDLKTGNREKSGFQLGVYKYAVRKLLNVTIDWGEYYYTKDGKSVECDLRRYTDSYIEDQLIKLDKAIQQEIFLSNPGDACTFCGVKEYCREVGTKSLA
jgi:CRISPR/Cas system-associated exonuclease Cas4 (RecB family)